MKTWQKVVVGAGAVAVLGGIVLFSVYQVNKGVQTVQSGKVAREDLTSIVTASGEVRPKNYTNVLGEGIGKITDIAVKEGDHVKRGDVLLHLESIQPGADVQAQMANVQGAEAGMKAASANYDAAVATLSQRQADLEKAKLDWQRSQSLYQEELISKSDYDAAHATYDSAVAALSAAKATIEQTRAAREESQLTADQARAILTHQQDVLRKTTYRAPIDGIVSYIAVRVGENVVPGIQNAEGSFLMTISDMSIVTAEVKVDETDITNIRNGDPADVSIDALPNKTFKGHVTEVGELAILRSSGQAATTQTTANTQEARDFKVVVTLDNPPDSLRPGLSSTAKIQTAQRKNVLTVPIQALAVRTQADLDEAKQGQGNVTLAASKPSTGAQKTDIQGVFVIRGNKAEFVPVQTGITGVTDIEVTSGLKEGDQIVTGSYKVLRNLRPGTPVKVDNSLPKHDESSS
ncbi:MAG TPA: efflux RND transporter periplasmic adaptor subunit [Candidatus Limnocylindrales bacterium]|nr:efflux RND transporter periplasmic adaptor subunit [Candidatus Limnocylindrales bacterium]